MNKSKYNDAINGALYPYDFLERQKCEPEWSNLEKALNDTRVTNIAISAPYDTGKTSFVLSFFTKKYIDFLKDRYGGLGIIKSDEELRKEARDDISENKTKIRFINLPNFFLEEKGKNSEIELEKDIIGQLLFNSNPWHYPDSKIKRLKEYPFWGILLAYVSIVTFILLCIARFNCKLDSFDKIFKYGKSLPSVTVITLILGCVLAFFIFYFVIHYFAKISWTLSGGFGDKVKFTSQFNVGDPSNTVNKDLLLLYGDELRYFFKKSKVQYVVFEDLDRYNQSLIFQRLHQVNINLNKGKQHIVFIYTLKDSVFSQKFIPVDSKADSVEDKKVEEKNRNDSAELKSKFFDYIIPLRPNTSFQNSKRKFKDEIENYPDLNDTKKESLYKGIIDEKYLDGLGNFIFDPREIVNIISEVATYARKLPTSFSFNKLLGVVIYKNEYPEDFENIIKGTSKLNCLMQNRSIFYETAKEEIDSKAPTSESASETRERIEDSKYGEIVKELIEHYSTKEELVIAIRKTKTFKDLDSQEQSLVNESISFVYDERLIRYLLLENLLDPNYCEYITSSAYSLSMSDRNFVQNVLSYHSYKSDQKLDNAEEVEKELDAAGANYRFAYSSNLIANLVLLSSKSLADEIIDDKVCKILETAKKIGDMTIISNVVTNLKSFENEQDLLSIFTRCIIHAWPDFYWLIIDTNIENEAVSPENRQLIVKTFLQNFSSNNRSQHRLNGRSVLDLSNYLGIMRKWGKENPRIFNKIDYIFDNLTFIRKNRMALKIIVERNNYRKNEHNFRIIMNRLLQQDFIKLLQYKDKYHISDKFIRNNAFKYYSSIYNYNLRSLNKLYEYFCKFVCKTIEQQQQFSVEILELYSDHYSVASVKNISEFLNNINFTQLIVEKMVDKKILVKLIRKNKLIYSDEIYKALCVDHRRIAEDYKRKFKKVNLIVTDHNNKTILL